MDISNIIVTFQPQGNLTFSYKSCSKHICKHAYLLYADATSDCRYVEESWYARGAAGISCLLVTLILLSELLCDHRAYKTTLQRMIMYYTLLSFVYQTLNSVNAIVHNHENLLSNNVSALETAAMYFANAAFFLPAIIINYLMYIILRLCCGCHATHHQSRLSTILTGFTCTMLGLVLSLMWIPFNIMKH